MKNIWIWIVVAIVVIGGGFYWWQVSQAPAPLSDDGTSAAIDAADDANTNQAPATTGAAVNVGTSVNVGTAPTTASITYNGSAFSPSSVTIKKGGSVTFTSTAGDMWVASAPHPAHTGYDGTSRSTHCAAGYSGAAPFDQCAAGTNYTFTFNKTGTWSYHNHLNTGAYGTVIVE